MYVVPYTNFLVRLILHPKTGGDAVFNPVDYIPPSHAIPKAVTARNVRDPYTLSLDSSPIFHPKRADADLNIWFYAVLDYPPHPPPRISTGSTKAKALTARNVRSLASVLQFSLNQETDFFQMKLTKTLTFGFT